MVIKEIKGSQYGVQLENAVRDRLAAEDKYEEEEETELEKVVGFFQSKYFKANSIITYHFSNKDGICEVYLKKNIFRFSLIHFAKWTEKLCLCLAFNYMRPKIFGYLWGRCCLLNLWKIGFETEGKEEEKLKVENANVVGMMQRWYLSGSRGVSPSTIVSLADSLSAVLT